MRRLRVKVAPGAQRQVAAAAHHRAGGVVAVSLIFAAGLMAALVHRVEVDVINYRQRGVAFGGLGAACVVSDRSRRPFVQQDFECASDVF